MPESPQHHRLVGHLRRWVAGEFFRGDLGTILSDSYGGDRASRPREIGGYVPDLFVFGTGAFCIIFGEAKTTADLESRHSLAQIEVFVRFCATTPGTLFVLAVPWYRVPYVKNLLTQWQKRYGLDVSRCRVLDSLPD